MIIIGNWKAYVERGDAARQLVTRAKKIATETRVKIVLAPPTPFLGLLAARNISKVSFGGQDISAVITGAHTGEVTAEMLAELGADYVILGHSERRTMGESLELISEKVRRAIATGLTPILCVGERERDSAGRYLAYVREEIASALEPLPPKERSKVIIAYEPIWAIGKKAKDAITPTDLAEMVLYIRKILAELLPGRTSVHAKVVYGGSVESGNARDLAATSSIDGFLVGHASVDAKEFAALVKAIS